MNTVKKGDAFEKTMTSLIKRLVENDELPINGKYCKVFGKKKYYSKDRDSDIIVDISVECTLPGEPIPSSYLMIECKDYSGKVPINDLEEFHSKTTQITGLNVKAIFLSTAPFQKAALNYAISKGIRIMRIHPDGRREVLSFRKDRHSVSLATAHLVQAMTALVEPEKTPDRFTYAGLVNLSPYFDIESFILSAIE